MLIYIYVGVRLQGIFFSYQAENTLDFHFS